MSSPFAPDLLTGRRILMDGLAGLTSLTADDWAEAREKSRAASAASRSQRS